MPPATVNSTSRPSSAASFRRTQAQYRTYLVNPFRRGNTPARRQFRAAACGPGFPAGRGGYRLPRDLDPIMEQVGDEGIRERLGGIVIRLRPGRGDRTPVLPHQPEPRNEEERA